MCSLASGAPGGYLRPLNPRLAQWDSSLPLRPAGRGAWAMRPCRGGGKGWCGPSGSAPPWESLVPARLRVRPARAGVRGRADRLRVLGGRGAAEEAEEDLPELSDSGDEAAWEEEDDAALPRDKQQTPCLFCDRFVRLGARGARAARACAGCSLGAAPEFWTAWPAASAGGAGGPAVLRRVEPRAESGLGVPFCTTRGFCTGSCGAQIWFCPFVP